MAKQWKPTARVYDRKIKDYVTVTLAVDIDWDAIAKQMAEQAWSNKSGKATQLHGAIKAKIISPTKP